MQNAGKNEAQHIIVSIRRVVSNADSCSHYQKGCHDIQEFIQHVEKFAKFLLLLSNRGVNS